MEDLLRHLIENAGGLWAYGTVFLVLLVCGLGVPIPEDISLVLGGFLAHKGVVSLSVMMIVCFAGIIVGDSLTFSLGRRFGSRVGRSPGGLVGRIITPQKRARVEALFLRHGPKVIMIARFLPGVRAVTYFTAGSVGMSYWRFIAFDGLAALASAPFFVYLGYRLGGELDSLIAALRRGQTGVIVGLISVVALYLLIKRVRSRRERRLEGADRLPTPTSVGALTQSSAAPESGERPAPVRVAK